MHRIHRRCGFAFILYSLALGAGPAWATYQVKTKVGKISYDSLELEERDGILGFAKVKSGIWQASAPTIADPQGRYFSVDPDGQETTLRLVKENGPHANWAFEFGEKWEPTRSNISKRQVFWEGPSGFKFKMKVAEGPFKDWYVAVEPLSDEAQEDPDKEPEWRPLKLVKDPKQALEFRYDDTNYKAKSN